MPLHATARFRLNRAYYEQLHSDWLRHISTWRRLIIPFGLLTIALGIFLHFTTPSHILLVLGIIGVGLYQIIQHVHHRRKWISDRLREKSFDHEVKIEFTDDRINISGPQGAGFCTWDAFTRTLTTPRGLFLWPRKGVHIYIPDSSLTPPEAKAGIAAKIGPRRP
ncbi:MAG TPA: hypothetical protein VD994_10985 [Prosthecobacter sp.]|nr:hypothetical protein [Prosthecobacter sp.]